MKVLFALALIALGFACGLLYENQQEQYKITETQLAQMTIRVNELQEHVNRLRTLRHDIRVLDVKIDTLRSALAAAQNASTASSYNYGNVQ